MKKLIALILAMLLLLCAVACGGGTTVDPQETTGGTEAPDGSDEGSSGGEDDGTTGGEDDASSDGDVTTEGQSGGTKEPVLQNAVTVDETVYLAVDGASYRTAPEALEENLAGALKWKDAVHRVLFNDEWSVIEIEETTYYLPTSCLSEDEPEGDSDFTAVSDTVLTEGTDVLLRTAPLAEDCTEQLYLDEGVSLRRVRYSDLWSVVVYEGTEYYIDATQHSGSQGSSAEDLVFNAYTGTLTVTADTATLYVVPSSDDGDAEIAGSATKGAALTAVLVSTDGAWYGVSYLDPATGMTTQVYVKASDVSVGA